MCSIPKQATMILGHPDLPEASLGATGGRLAAAAGAVAQMRANLPFLGSSLNHGAFVKIERIER